MWHLWETWWVVWGYFKLKKVNNVVFKKLCKLELENESLLGKLEESTRILNELRRENESLNSKVKSLTSDLEKIWCTIPIFY